MALAALAVPSAAQAQGALLDGAPLNVFADAMRLSLAVDPLPDTGDTSTTWTYDVILDELRDVIVPGIVDGFASRRAKGTARLVKYLREVDRLGGAARQAEGPLGESFADADRNPPTFDPETHAVTLPESFKKSLRAWQQGEWFRIGLSETVGGVITWSASQRNTRQYSTRSRALAAADMT